MPSWSECNDQYEAVCPYCGHHNDPWYGFDDSVENEGDYDVPCNLCGKTFRLTTTHDIRFSTKTMEEVEDD